jgi:hypothetical protein
MIRVTTSHFEQRRVVKRFDKPKTFTWKRVGGSNRLILPVALILVDVKNAVISG